MSSPPTLRFQPPPGTILLNYNIRLPSTQQLASAGIPQTYLDSQAVRTNVFVDEQKAVPIKYQQDRDDARSFVWVLYSPSPNPIPIGTIRLVPFPHQAHPTPGSRLDAPEEEPPNFSEIMLFNLPLPVYEIDRKTSLHDGVETYIKLGRLCVVKEERGKRYADLLIKAALDWASENPGEIGIGAGEEVPKWKGLVCLHARETAVGVWERHGFVVDEAMGIFFEGGIRHVGMFRRIDLEGK